MSVRNHVPVDYKNVKEYVRIRLMKIVMNVQMKFVYAMISLVRVGLKKMIELFRRDFPLVQQITIWSNWTQIIPKDEVNNEEITTEMRTRFVCTMALVSDQQSLEIKSDQINYRICHKKASSCHETGNLKYSVQYEH